MKCMHCSIGEFRGLPKPGSPDYYATSVYFWCPKLKHHNAYQNVCDKFISGNPKCFDEHGDRIFRHDWHRPYEDNPYIEVICASLPPKIRWDCAICNSVVYTTMGDEPPVFGCIEHNC